MWLQEEVFENVIKAENPVTASRYYREFLKYKKPEERCEIIATYTYPPLFNIVFRYEIPNLLKNPTFFKLYQERASYSPKVDSKLASAEAKMSEKEMEKYQKPAKYASGIEMVCLPSFEPATHWGTGFIRRWNVPRAHPGFFQLWRWTDLKAHFRMKIRHSTFIFGVGHGNVDVFTGQWFRKLMRVGDIPPVREKKLKLLSCLCGQKLGSTLIKAGATFFQGYIKEYVFHMGGMRYWPSPAHDSVANMFLGGYCSAVKSLQMGEVCDTAYNVELAWYNGWIERTKCPECRAHLKHDADALVMLGDRWARV